MPELLENKEIALSDRRQDDAVITETLMKDGSTIQVEVDKLAEFWAAKKENIQPQKFSPRRPRANSK
jgi:hypothetical protein